MVRMNSRKVQERDGGESGLAYLLFNTLATASEIQVSIWRSLVALGVALLYGGLFSPSDPADPTLVGAVTDAGGAHDANTGVESSRPGSP